MAMFGGKRQEALESAPHRVEDDYSDVQFQAIDLLDGNLVAVDQFGRPWAVDNDNPDPDTFKVVNLIHSGGNQYFAVANNGQHFPISHELFGQLSREDKRVDVSSNTDNGFYERRHSPTGGSIEISSNISWKVQNPEDYDSGRRGALAHMAGIGILAQQTLAVQTPEAMARQQQEEEARAQAIELQRQYEMEERRRLFEQSQRQDAAHDTYQMPPAETRQLSLEDKLMGGVAEDDSAAPASTTVATDLAAGERVPRQPKHKTSKHRRTRRLLHYALASTASVGLMVPATHTMAHVVGSHMPLIKFDKNDPMALNGEFGHDIALPVKGLLEMVTIVSGGKVNP